MSDKHNNNWSPDETFWEEAWTDMDRRLDRKKVRSPLWLLLLLPFLIGGAIWILTTDRSATASSTNLVVEQVQSPSSDDKFERSATSPFVQSATLPDTTATANEKAAVIYAVSSSGDTTIAGRESETLAYDATPDRAVIPAEPVLSASDVENFAPAFPAPKVVAELATDTIPYLDYSVGLVMRARLTGRHFDVKALRTPKWIVSGGINYFPDATGPGGYLQNTFEVKAGQWTIPLSLRLERSKRGVTLEQSSLRTEDSFSPNLNNLDSSAQSEIFVPSRGDEINITTVELRAGIGRHLGPKKRLMISAGAGVGYLIAGSGPIFRPSRQSIDITENREPLSFYGNNNSVQLASGSTYRDLNLAVDRLDLSGWLQLDYHLGSRLSISGSWSHTATAIYADRALKTDRNGFSIGLGYRY